MITLTVDEFIKFTESEPDNWINYCEINMLPNGRVFLARPSHRESIIQFVMEKEGKTRTDIQFEMTKDLLSPTSFYIDKYKLVAIWFNYILHSRESGLTDEQELALSKLEAAHLIRYRHGSVATTSEYTNYLYRQKQVAR